MAEQPLLIPAVKEASKEEKGALNFAVDNFDSDNPEYRNIAIQVGDKMGLNINHVKAMRYAKGLEDSYLKERGYVAIPDIRDSRIKDANKIRNAIYDDIAKARPALNVQGVSPITRGVIKNLIDNDPAAQRLYLEKQGYQTRISDGDVEVKRPGDTRFSKIDPSDLDLQDASDLLYDVAQTVIVGGAGSLGMATGGIIGAGTLGAGASAALENVRQNIAKYADIRKEINAPLVYEQGAYGSLEGLVPGMIGLVKKTGSMTSLGAKKIKANAEELISRMKDLGLEPKIWQLVDAPDYTKAIGATMKLPYEVLTKKWKDQVREVYDSSKNIIRGWLDDGDFRDSAIKGLEVKEAFADDFGKLMMPVEAAYQRVEDVLNTAKFAQVPGIMPDAPRTVLDKFKQPLLRSIAKFKESPEAALEPGALKYLEKTERYLNEFVTSIGDIKNFRTYVQRTVNDALKNVPGSIPEARLFGSVILKEANNFRNDALNALAKGHKLAAEVNMFEKLDKSLRFYPEWREFAARSMDLNQDIRTTLKGVRDLTAKGKVDVYKIIDSPEIQEMTQGISDYIADVMGTLNKDSNLYKKLSTTYDQYLKDFVNSDSAIDMLRFADTEYVKIRQALNKLVTKSGYTQAKGAATDVFEDFIAKTPDVDFVKKVVDTADINKAKAVKEAFPQAFEKLRRAKIGEIFSDLNDFITKPDVGKRLSPKAEINRKLSQMSASERNLVFGEDANKKLETISMVLNSFPEDINPSNTAVAMRGMEALREIMTTPIRFLGSFGQKLRIDLAERELKNMLMDKGLIPKVEKSMLRKAVGLPIRAAESPLTRAALREGAETTYRELGGGNE